METFVVEWEKSATSYVSQLSFFTHSLPSPSDITSHVYSTIRTKSLLKVEVDSFMLEVVSQELTAEPFKMTEPKWNEQPMIGNSPRETSSCPLVDKTTPQMNFECIMNLMEIWLSLCYQVWWQERGRNLETNDSFVFWCFCSYNMSTYACLPQLKHPSMDDKVSVGVVHAVCCAGGAFWAELSFVLEYNTALHWTTHHGTKWCGKAQNTVPTIRQSIYIVFTNLVSN